MVLLLFFDVFITWIGTETVPPFVDNVDAVEEEQHEE
jgi:hypothetical protein